MLNTYHSRGIRGNHRQLLAMEALKDWSFGLGVSHSALVTVVKWTIILGIDG